MNNVMIGNKTNKNHLLFLCILLTPIINIGLDIYTPSLPALSKFFGASTNAINLTILVYTAAFGIIQPLVGPASDRYGRKPFIWAALICYLIGSIAASTSHHLTTLYLSRIAQGVGAAIISANIKGMLVDVFEGKALAKANSYFSLSWSVTPILAPALGGFLQHHFSWQANFIVMTVYCLLCILFTAYYLVETNPSIKQDKKHISFLKKWAILLSEKRFYAYNGILAIQFAVLLLYYLFAPYVIQTQLHYTAAQYGQIMLLLGLAYLLGNVANRLLLNVFEVNTLVLAGLIASLLTTSILMILSIYQPISIKLAVIPFFVLFFWDGIIFANVLTHCLIRYKQFPATAGALVGGMINLICTGITYGANHFLNLHNLIVLSTIYTFLMITALVLFFVAFSK